MDDFVLQADEKKLLVFRKHWLVFVGNLIPFFLLAIVPLIALGILGGTVASSAAGGVAFFSLANPWVRFLLGVYWLFLWMACVSNFVRYYFDIWIVTNLRIIDIEQHDFFDREVNSLFLESAEDITVENPGFFQTILNFGNILVQTAGAAQKTVFPNIPNPTHVREVIMSQIKKNEHSRDERQTHVHVEP